MTRRSARVARLCQLADRQEEVARLAMARSEIALRGAEAAGVETARQTQRTLNGDVSGQFRGALIQASISSDQRQAARIVELQVQLDADRGNWETERQKAASMGKLRERLEAVEKQQAEKAAERELGDIISSRIARREAMAS